VGLGAEELRPGRPGSLWRRVDPGGGEDLLDGGGVDLVADAGEFAVNASITTGRVLTGQVDCQCPQVRWGGWRPGLAVAGGSVAGGESRRLTETPQASTRGRGARRRCGRP
jgi:hypothetical protein